MFSHRHDNCQRWNGKREKGITYAEKDKEMGQTKWGCVRADELKAGNNKKYYKEGTFSHWPVLIQLFIIVSQSPLRVLNWGYVIYL